MTRMKTIKPKTLLATALLAPALIFCLATLFTPHDPGAISIAQRFAAPSLQHWLGTDALGRDLLTRLAEATRASLSIAVAATTIAITLGAALGFAAATQPHPQAAKKHAIRLRLRQATLTFIADLPFAFPLILTALLFTLALGPGFSTTIVAIALFLTPIFAKITRTQTRQLQTQPFVEIARLSAPPNRRAQLNIIRRHLLPNTAPHLAVQACLQLAVAVLAEAGLSYLGLGIPPPAASLGRMLYEAQTLVHIDVKLSFLPGILIISMALGFNLLGERFRDQLDPGYRSRHSSPSAP